LELEEMPFRKTDGLRAGEIEVIAPQQGGDLAAELIRQFGLGFDAYSIEIGNGWVAHFRRKGDGGFDSAWREG
jgi:hypothetical protein